MVYFKLKKVNVLGLSFLFNKTNLERKKKESQSNSGWKWLHEVIWSTTRCLAPTHNRANLGQVGQGPVKSSSDYLQEQKLHGIMHGFQQSICFSQKYLTEKKTGVPVTNTVLSVAHSVWSPTLLPHVKGWSLHAHWPPCVSKHEDDSKGSGTMTNSPPKDLRQETEKLY